MGGPLSPDAPLVCANTERPIFPWVAAGNSTLWPEGDHCDCGAHDVLAVNPDAAHLFEKAEGE